MILDNRLLFEEHLGLIFNKINKTMGLLRKLQYVILRSLFLAKYRTFVRFHVAYGDIKYEKAYNNK